MRVDILYTVNSQYKEIMLTSCVSLILNNMDKDIHFHIVTSDFSCLDYEYCKSVLSKFSSATCKFYPLDKKYIEKFNIPNWRGSQIANAGIFFQDLIDLTEIQKLLYLDADTIVVSDIKDAFNYSNPINAVLDSCLQKRVDKMNPFTLEFDEYMKYVNENFKKEELYGFWQILNENKYLLYMAILAPNYLPLSVNRTLRKVIKKFK